MRFVLSGAAAGVLTASEFPVPSGICPCGHVPTGSALLFSAGYTLAAFGGSLRDSSQNGVVSLTVLWAPRCGAATLPEAPLAFSIGAIARSVCAGGGYDLVDERDAVRIPWHDPDEFGHECGHLKQANLKFLRVWSLEADADYAALVEIDDRCACHDALLHRKFAGTQRGEGGRARERFGRGRVWCGRRRWRNVRCCAPHTLGILVEVHPTFGRAEALFASAAAATRAKMRAAPVTAVVRSIIWLADRILLGTECGQLRLRLRSIVCLASVRDNMRAL
jgi:hypothetical protein